ncbi:haloacid dehalogenase type II [Acuticoccus kandeliae]|uniref:haloacid dehalogenase type II n=1 Tax=Acuticoccus kandeliae TaxID=2073160 RepID=UPI00196A4F0A|nr:haloacid dehalogenase type II [Acuticoccus kandeliae]
MSVQSEVKVIVFDTFGTVVDWRGSIVRDLSAWGAARGLDLDWTRLADLWRGRYDPQKARVRSGELPWTNLDDLHRESLVDVLADLGAPPLPDADLDHINRVWHRLAAWPDAVAGLTRLKTRYVIGPLSNGNVALLVNMAKAAGLPWDHAFSCELFGHYKPDPETYLGVCKMMYAAPSEVMMCAAHNYDLAAARECGLRTAFIPRPTEHGEGQTKDLVPEDDWDIVAADMNDLARQMGV